LKAGSNNALADIWLDASLYGVNCCRMSEIFVLCNPDLSDNYSFHYIAKFIDNCATSLQETNCSLLPEDGLLLIRSVFDIIYYYIYIKPFLVCVSLSYSHIGQKFFTLKLITLCLLLKNNFALNAFFTLLNF
jgi:hypothetical protein